MMGQSLADTWAQRLPSWRRPSATTVLWASLAVLLAAALLRLTIGGGGRDLESLTLVQTVVFAAAGLAFIFGMPRPHGVLRALGAVVTAVVVTSLWTIRPESSVRQVLLWFTYLGIFIVLAASLRTLSAARRFVDALVVIGGLVALFGLYLFWGADDAGARLYSTFYAANAFAAFLLLILPLTLSRLACAETRRDVFDFGFVAVLLATALQLTSSRGAWFALVVVVPLGILTLRPPSWTAAVRRLAVVAVLTIAAVTLLTRAPWSMVGRTSALLESGNRSVGDRFGYWVSALEVFRDHPIVGTGPGTFGFVHQQYQRSILVYAQDPHNIYLQTAAEMGVLGLVALAVLMTSLAVLWLHVLRQFPRGSDHGLAAGVGFSLAAFFVHSGLEMNFSFPADPAMAFALAGVLGAYAGLAAGGSLPSTSTKIAASWWRYGLAALTVLAIAAVQMQQAAARNFQEGRTLLYSGQANAAAVKFGEAMKWNPLNPRYPSAGAEALSAIRPGDPHVARLVRRSMALDRNNPYYPLQLAKLLMAQPNLAGRAGEIEALIRRSLTLDPYHLPDAFQALADLNARLGNPAAVEHAYQEALARFGGQGVAQDEVLRAMLWNSIIPLYLHWAEYLAVDGRRREALSVLESLLAEDPAISVAYLRIADLHVQAGSFAAADRVLRRGLLQAAWDEDLWVRWRTLPGRRTPVYER